jgi:2-amino-4-hydroxy-6-hydroxymethyldihydropteridine diphosphokinase
VRGDEGADAGRRAKVVIGVGGNLGSQRELRDRFAEARRRVAACGYAGEVAASPLYRSDPVGPVTRQPAFLNAVFAFEQTAAASPLAILDDLLALESSLGRDRTGAVPGGPRHLDLDLLMVGRTCLAAHGPPRLLLPHPRLRERAFVLRPLADLLGAEFVVPGPEPTTVGQLLASERVTEQRLELVATRWV